MKEMKTLNGYALVDEKAREILKGLDGGYITTDMFGAIPDTGEDMTEQLTAFFNYDCPVKIMKPGVYNVTGIEATGLKNTTILAYGAKLNMTNLDMDKITNQRETWVLTNKRTFDLEPFDGYLNLYGLEIDGNADEAVLTKETTNSSLLLCAMFSNYKSVYVKEVYVHHSLSGGGVQCFNCDEICFDSSKAEHIGWAAHHHKDFVKFPFYEWDAFGGTGRGYTAEGWKHNFCSKATIKNCIFNEIAGCSVFGGNYMIVEAYGNRSTNNHGYWWEDRIYEGAGRDDGKVYTRLLHDNRFDNCGNIYAYSSSPLYEGETVNVSIMNNICNNVFGDASHIAERDLVLTYNSLGRTTGVLNLDFINNEVYYAEEIDTSQGGNTKLGGISCLIQGKITIADNIFINKSQTVSKPVLSAGNCVHLLLEDNYIKQYAHDNVVATSINTIGDISGVEIYNNKIEGTHWGVGDWVGYQYAIQIIDAVGINITANDNFCNHGSLLGVTGSLPRSVRMRGNVTKGHMVVFQADYTGYLSLIDNVHGSSTINSETVAVLNKETTIKVNNQVVDLFA